MKHMDSVTNIMFDTFKHQIWEELGPLDPCWFDVLTAKATEVGDATVAEEEALININANLASCGQDGKFKTPFKKCPLESQLFSTPKIFRRCGMQSPETEDELLCPRQANAEKETTLPWADSSPCLFETSKHSTSNQNRHPQDLFGTPKETVASSVKRISESLGAQLNPDVSWTSSLNTPPVMTPTLILSKSKDQMGMVSPSAEKEILFVRKLFPSLSNTSGVDMLSPEKKDAALGQNSCNGPACPGSSEESLLNVCNSWRQTLPSAIEDGDVRCTVASILDGAEDALSIFFSNSDSALRRVKSKDRIKRNLSGLTMEPESTPPVSTRGNHESSKNTNEEANSGSNPASINAKTTIKTGDSSSTQWTQISLSDMSDCDMTHFSHAKSSTGHKEANNFTSEQHRTGSESCYLGVSGMTGSAGKSLQEHTKKTRKFVYGAQNTAMEVSGIQLHKLPSSPRNDMSGRDPIEKICGDKLLEIKPNSVAKNTTEGNNHFKEKTSNPQENAVLLKPTKDQVSDSLPVSEAVAEYFTQTADSSKPGSKKEETTKDGLFASSCLLALRQKKKRLMDKMESADAQHQNSKGVRVENTVSDSGYSSTLADVGHKTELSFNHSVSSCCGFKIGNNVTISLPPEGIQEAKTLFDDFMEGKSTTNISFANHTSPQLSPHPDNINSLDSCAIALNNSKRQGKKSNAIKHDLLLHSPHRVDIDLPFDNAIGFKKASEKHIEVSTASLEKATDLFTEIEQIHFDKHPTPKQVCTDEVEKLAACESVKVIAANSCCMPSLESPLTASQRADVSELCTFLEEAESQFEFTQYKSAKPNTHPGKDIPSHKECDPEFLAGIDFDDSFCTDADKQLSKITTPERTPMLHRKAPVANTKSTTSCSFKETEEKAVHAGQVLPLFSCSSKLEVGGLSPDRDRDSSEMKNLPDITAVTMAVGFQTARGNNMIVSEKSLNRARTLFEDLEDSRVTTTDTPDGFSCIATDVKRVEHVFDKQGRGNCLNIEEKGFINGNTFENSNLMDIEDRESNSLGSSAEKIHPLNGIDLHGSVSKPVNDVLGYTCTEHTEKRNAFKKDKLGLDRFDRQNYGLKMAHGDLTVATKTLGETSALFKDRDKLENIDCVSSKPVSNTGLSNFGLGYQKDNACCLNTAQYIGQYKKYNTEQNSQDIANRDIQQDTSGFKKPIRKAISVAAKGTLKPRQLSYMSNSTSKKGEQSHSSVTLKKDIGFSTASGKTLSVSNEALVNAKALLNECDKEDIEEITEKNTNNESLKHNISVTAVPQNKCRTGVKIGVGFSTAGGKKVSVSDEALMKAKTLLNECGMDDTQEIKKTWSKNELCQHNGLADTLTEEPVSSAVQGGTGFSTAGGKKVSVSNEALLKAKILLDECGKEDTQERKQRMSSIESLKQNSAIQAVPQKEYSTALNIGAGFSTAGGKRVSVSVEALIKAKTIFNECDKEDINKITESRRSIESLVQKSTIQAVPQKKCSAVVKRGAGFSTAGGKQVSVSDEALLKDKTLLNECSKDDTQEIRKIRNDKETLRQSSTLQVVPQKEYSTVLSIGAGFSTAGGKHVSVSDEALLKAKTLLNECGKDDIQKVTIPSRNIASLNHNISVHALPQKNVSTVMKGAAGFSTASGRQVSVSDEALVKAKALFDESETPIKENAVSETSISEQLPISSIPALQLSNGSTAVTYGTFSTANGKELAVTDGALMNAKVILNECEEDHRNELIETNNSCKNQHPPSPVRAQLQRGGGFQTASGKGVAISNAALLEVKTLFNECDYQTDSLALSKTKNVKEDDRTAMGLQKSKLAFTTVGGEKVLISETNLLRAKTLLNELDDGGVKAASEMTPRANSVDESKSTFAFDINSLTGKTDANTKQHPPKCSDSFSTASQNTVSMSNESIQKAKFRECEETVVGEKVSGKLSGEKRTVSFPTLIHNELAPVKTRGPKDCEITRQSQSRESSSLGFQSLGLSGCTVTQQKYFAQEAIDCTKALLEDDDLGDLNLTATCGGPLMQQHSTHIEESGDIRRGLGKRSVDDVDITDHPPSKRRLLDEFDRFVKNPRQSILNPAKSSSDGVLKDRRVFKYNVSLHPNVTRPFRIKKSCPDPGSDTTQPQQTTPHSISGDSKPICSRTPVFVPPCRKKNVMPEITKTRGPQETAATPGVFVPPIPQKFSPAHEQSNVTIKTPTHVSPSEQQSFATEITGDGKTSVTQTVPQQNTIEVGRRVSCGKNLNVDPGPDVASAASLVVIPEESLVSTQDIAQNIQSLQLARDMQDMRIRKKKRQTIRPLPGSLFLAKTSGVDRVSLREAVDGRCPGHHTQKQLYGYGVHQHVSEVTSENAESFRFKCQHFFKQETFIDGGGIQLADGGWLIPSNNGTAGKEEFYRAFCDSPGVDPKLISEDWLYNHYRWIVWKQASMERSFPAKMGSLCLTPEQVLLQLKYRYDVEVDHSRRPALRKIMERDDTAAKTMVLCVCGVVSKGTGSDPVTPQPADSKPESPVGIIWLTDGWYAIKAQIDVPLTALLRKGRLAIGGKVVIHGAELIGSQDACSPLEAPEALMLKIGANNTRSSCWDAKLGFYPDPRPFRLPISSLYSHGGPVGCVDIVILRSYPAQWMEKKPDGGYVFRNSRAEEKEVRRYNNNKQKAIEILFSKVQAQFEQEELGNRKRGRRQALRRQDIETLQDGEELHEAVENDPVYLENRLSDQQLQVLNNYRRSLGEKKQADLQERYRKALEEAQGGEGGFPKREVTQVWKLSIADRRDQLSSVVYSLNIWRPSVDMQSFLKEGGGYRAYHLATSDGKKRGANATVNLTVTKKTQFEHIRTSPEWLAHQFQPRISAHFVELQNPEFRPLCGEVDLVGYVCSITDRQGHSPVLYLVDGKLNFVKVRCSNNLTQLGLDDLVKPLSLLALSNLQLRHQPSTTIPSLYAGDLTLFSTNPKETHLQEAFTNLRNFVLGEEHFFQSAEERLSNLNQVPSRSSFQSPALPPKTPVSKAHALDFGKANMTHQQPLRNVGSFTPQRMNLTPLAISSGGKDPKSVKRKRGLDYLSRVPSPPPLSPLATLVSPSLKKTFNPPRKAVTPCTLKTDQTPARRAVPTPAEGGWVKDEELAMIDTQALHEGL